MLPTVNETLAMLRHSKLPTVIVEGKDDIKIYRQMKKRFDINVTRVGGRIALLEIFENVCNDENLQSKPIYFIADKDIWVNIGIPEKYQHQSLIFTEGYSLENDLFQDYKCLEKIENFGDKQKFDDDLDKFITWYGLALQETIINVGKRVLDNYPEQIHKDRNLSKHPNEVLNNYDSLISLKENEEFPQSLNNELKQNFVTHLRGKSLLQLFVRTKKKYNEEVIFEELELSPKEKILQIFSRVELLLSAK